jgi:hypothetical protein
MLSYTHVVLSHEFVVAKEKRLKYSHERRYNAGRCPASVSPTSSQFPSNGQNQHYTTRMGRAVIMLDIGDIKDGEYRSLEQIIQCFLETARQGVQVLDSDNAFSGGGGIYGHQCRACGACQQPARHF